MSNKAISALNHPHICTLHDIGSHEGTGYLVMEFVEGKPVKGPSPASPIAAILKEEPPPLTPMPAGTQALDHTLRKCLAKDPARRWQTATDLRDELVWIAGSAPLAQPDAVSRRALLPWIGGAAVAGAGLAGVAAWALRGRSVAAPARAVRFRLFAPEAVWPERVISRQSMAVSPVGGMVATIASDERGPIIWLQRLDSSKATPLPGTEGARIVFWSPDAKFIGFFADGKLKKIPAEGGTPLALCEVPVSWSATWNANEEIVAWSREDSALISVRSGVIGTFPRVFWPRFLPDGKHLLYVRIEAKTGGFLACVQELATHREKDLFRSDTQVVYAPDPEGSKVGRLIFGRGSTLLTQRFDSGALTAIGDPEPVAEGVPFFKPTAWSEFDASADGVLVFSAASPKSQLVWVDRSGHPAGTVGPPQNFYGGFRLSPDGSKIAADVADLASGGTDIWVYDITKSISERVTFEPGVEGFPVWSPDGKRLAFGSSQSSPPRLRMKLLTDHGSGEGFAPSIFQIPIDWSPDGRWILFQTGGGDVNSSIWLASVSDRKVMPLVQTSFNSSSPALSPDGRFLAFSANETGRPEIYVQGFESGDTPKLIGDRRRVSQEGGDVPRWRRDGKELFFIAPDRRLFSVSTTGSRDLGFGTPAPLFRLPISSRLNATFPFTYDVSLDGQRILLPNRDAASAPLNVLVNWQATLKT